MGLFDMSDNKIKALNHRAEVESNRGFVDPKKHEYLHRAASQYARENNCSYNDAMVFAKTGKKLF